MLVAAFCSANTNRSLVCHRKPGTYEGRIVTSIDETLSDWLERKSQTMRLCAQDRPGHLARGRFFRAVALRLGLASLVAPFLLERNVCYPLSQSLKFTLLLILGDELAVEQ